MRLNTQLGPIAYLVQTFPGLTTVYREVIALRNKGLDVQTLATWPTERQKVSPEAQDLISGTFYIFPIRWLSFIKAHFHYLFSRPLTYIKTLLFVLSRPNQTISKRFRTLLHFAEALYLAAEVERRHIQHIHVHFAGNAATLALIVKRLTGIPFSFTAHAYDIFLDQVILKEKVLAASFVVTISEYNKRFIIEYVGDSQLTDKIHVIHSGIPLTEFDTNDAPPPSTLDDKRPLILSVGRLVEKKGFSVLIRACKLLKEQGYCMRCVIIGSGPQEQELRYLIKQLDLDDTVELKGWLSQTQIRTYLSQTAIFALPCVVAANGDQDGIPAVLMEAMAMSIPCVSTTISGIPELIENEVSGLLVQEKDPVTLADALCRLLNDKDLADRLGQSGQEKVFQEFNLEKVSEELLDCLLMKMDVAPSSTSHPSLTSLSTAGK